MKKTTILPLIMMSAMLSGCFGDQIKVNPDKEKYVVGIAQFAQHPALDAATNGFKDKLSELLKGEGREVGFDYQDALGKADFVPNIISKLVSKDVDLILANATPCVTGAYNATTYIPIIGTSVTDYGVAITNPMTDGKSGTNVSGTSDLAPLDAQIDEMVKLVSTAKTVNKVGILYCSKEANSEFQVNEARKALEAKGIAVREFAFSEDSELQGVVNAATSQDAIYIPTDNTCARLASVINNILEPNNVPVYAGESGICDACGFATLSIDYYTLGEITGEMAFNVLLGKEDIRTMAIKYDDNPVKMYKADRCAALGITVGEDYSPME